MCRFSLTTHALSKQSGFMMMQCHTGVSCHNLMAYAQATITTEAGVMRVHVTGKMGSEGQSCLGIVAHNLASMSDS